MNSLKRILWVLSVLALAPRYGGAQTFAYVANANSNNVSAFTINPATGALVAVPGSPFAAGSTPFSVAVDPAGKFAYVTNLNSGNISAYTIDPVTGALSAVPGSPFAGGSTPLYVTVDPKGKFAYVTNMFSSSVSAYTINPATGALTAAPGSPFAADGAPQRVAVDPMSKFAYVATAAANSIWAFSIDPASGALTTASGSPFSAGTVPESVAVHPSGKFAYATNSNSFNISAYTINPETGALTAIPGSPFPAGGLPFGMTVDPTGKFAYVANDTSNNVSAYTINPATGTLTAVPDSPFASGENPCSVAVDPLGRFVYVTNQQLFNGGGGNVSAYSISPATGALTTVPGSPFIAGTHPISIAVIAVQRDNRPPTTIATASPASNSVGWNKTNVTLNLNADDNSGGSGVKQIQFALSGAQNIELQTEVGHAASVTISAEGTTTLSYFATDKAGNQESAKTVIVRIDKTPPIISGLPGPDCSIWPPNHKLVKVANVVAGDALSGITPGSFTVTGTSNDATSGSVVITGGPNQFQVQLGADKGLIYTLTATAGDLAGNTLTRQAMCTVPHNDER